MKKLIAFGIAVVVLLLIKISKPDGQEDQRKPYDRKGSTQSSREARAPSKRDFSSFPELPPYGIDVPRFIQSEHQLVNDPTNPEDMPPENEALKDLTIKETVAIDLVYQIITSAAVSGNDRGIQGNTNIEMTNLMLGQNMRHTAYLSEGHPRLSQLGELTDKWGTPYSFHVISGMAIEITSAGVDGVFDTKDDVVLDFPDIEPFNGYDPIKSLKISPEDP